MQNAGGRSRPRVSSLQSDEVSRSIPRLRQGRTAMKYRLGATLFVLSILMAGSPAAQDARGLLQAADRAIGASAVNSVQYNATGWIRFLGQNFTADQDWNRVDLQSYTATVDSVSYTHLTLPTSDLV